jgi:hypothetical protein
MSCIISVSTVVLNFTTEGLDMVGVNQYGGYSIEWDITCNPDTNLWQGKAVIMYEPDSLSGASNVHSISGRDDFLTEDEARNYIIGEATQWIDCNPADEPKKVL